MNGHHWQQQQARHGTRGQLSPDPVAHGHAPNSTYEAHRLFAAYPTASATPSTHVARHMNNLSVSASNPTYLQPTYLDYNSGSQYQPAPAPPPFSEYSHELSYLSAPSMPTSDSRYWHNTRDESVRLLSQGGSFTSSQFASPWLQSQPQSTYHSLPFAHSLIQRMNPPAAYPTPPPPGIRSTSSSLAFALGHPLTYPNQSKPSNEHVHKCKEPVPAFNDFIAQKNRDIEMKPAEHDVKGEEPPRSTQPPSQVASRSLPSDSHPVIQPVVRSPPIHVPLSTHASQQLTPRSTTRLHRLPVLSAPRENSVTPQKRKYAGEDKGSPLKRVHTVSLEPQEELNMQFRSLQTTPSSSRVTPRQVMAYVEVPPLPSVWRTPSKKQSLPPSMSTPPDNLDASGSDEEDDARYKLDIHASVKMSARRTGDRDERVPLEKLSALIEDIFEAEDSLAVDIDISELPKDFFSVLTIDCSHPHLQPTVIRKLTKYLSQLARPAKRSRRSVRDGIDTPRARKVLGDIDNAILGRLLKFLERSIKAGEALDPLRASTHVPHADKNASPRKPKKSPRAQRVANQDRDVTGSASLNVPEDTRELELESTDVPQELTESDLHDLAKQLEVARDSILAVECCVALLSGEGLTKQLYSEELITSCLSTVKNQLTMILYPFVEAAGVGGLSSPQLQCIHSNTHPHSSDLRRLLSELFQAVSAVLPRINVLFSGENIVMSDAIIIQTVYIAIGPFFVVESGEGDVKGKKDNVVLNTLGNSAMRGLRLDALSVIRSIFANHEEQRSWIIEEILSSLIKLSNTHKKAGQFRLRDGRSIRTVSALLFQLVQTSAHDVRVAARKIAKRRQSRQALRRQDSMANEKSAEPVMDELDAEEMQLYITGLESAMNAAKTIVVYLTQRSGKGKLTKNSNEAEYRTIFDNLISDLLVVLYWPEWPAASLLLSIVCKFMVSSLDDVKTSTQTDTNAAKSIALDHLGVIAARIRSSSLKVKARDHDKHGLHSLDEVISSGDVKHLDTLISRHQSIFSHLYKRSSEDQAYDSANDLTAATWGQELAVALKQLSNSEQQESKGLHSNLYAKLKSALREVWKDMSNDVFDVGSQEEVNRVDRYAEEIGTVQTLRNSFGPILNVVLLALDAPAVFMRTKALRALGQIVNSDSSILAAPNVRRAIESHLLDSSPAVRDAAVELIGKYMIESPEVVGDYYAKIADRIADTGLGVRKRVIKLLKQYYAGTDDLCRRIDIATKLVLRMLDEDDTVKDLAIKTVEEVWFQAASQSGVPKTRSVPPSGPGQDKGPLLSKVSVIMGVSANFKDRQSPLEDMLHKIISSQEAASASYLRGNYSEICEVLIDGLVDASDLPGFTVHNCVRTIYLFTTAYPSVLSGANASTLLPYLKNPSTSEELVVSDYLLKIFRISIPHMPKTAVKFGQELQLVLQPMIVKPSHIGAVVSLQESVACMCGAVQHLTHDFNRLVALVKSCNARLQQAIARPVSYQMTAVENRTLSILIFIVALLGEHCDFDRLRDEHPDFVSDLNTVSPGPIVEHIYKSLLELYEKYDDIGLKGRILQCLGFLFRAQPTLMTLGRSASIMDDIFHSSDLESRGRLLRIMHDFLVSESMKHHEEQKGGAKGKQGDVVDMAELVGNTDGFADSGVSSAVVQRYISSILDAALSQNSQIQNVAVDILSFTIKQGLAHPLQSFPVIVALETSPNAAISSRANALHAILWSKHASLLNARYIISARQSFDYQKRISVDAVKGYRTQPEPTALLQRWYSLVREKRAPRQDFLRALLKSFEINPSLRSSQDDVDFARYMAENFSSLDYRTQEEVITVIKHLTSVLSTAGMQVIDLLSPSHLLAQLHDTQHNAPHQLSTSGPIPSIDQEIPNPPSSSAPLEMPHIDVAVMRSSVTIGIVMLLKAHLKSLYGLSEEKCSKFVLSKKSAIGDKPAIKRHQLPIMWTRLPYATTSLIHAHDLTTHRLTFIEVWNEDGVTAEPEDDDI